MKDAQNGGHKGLEQAVKHRLATFRTLDPDGLFEWVGVRHEAPSWEGDGEGEGDVESREDPGYFVAIMRHEGVEAVRQFGSEIFIDRCVCMCVWCTRAMWGRQMHMSRIRPVHAS